MRGQTATPPVDEHWILVVAHPDDEAIGAGHLLQRVPGMHVVICTDGSPDIKDDWQPYGSRERYAEVRKEETRRALKAVQHCGGVSFLGYEDGALMLNATKLMFSLTSICNSRTAKGIVTHLCEGGHPDHDVCAIVAAHVAERRAIPSYHMPLYGQNSGNLLRQKTRESLPSPHQIIHPNSMERGGKTAMFSCYESQLDVLAKFDSAAPEVLVEQDPREVAVFLKSVSHYIFGAMDGQQMLKSFRAAGLQHYSG